MRPTFTFPAGDIQRPAEVLRMLPSTCRAICLKVRPTGLPGPEHLELVERPLGAIPPGMALVRNRLFRVSASLRMMVSEGAEAVPGVPIPALRPGDALAGEALGEVVSAPPESGLAPGSWVLHHLGWRDYAVVPVADCMPVSDTLPDAAAHLGHGWTAFAALTQGASLRAGDTVLVTSAAGAIGSMAGQIARLLGARRVVGTTSSRAKADRLKSELGYDAVVIRGARPIEEQLAEAAPDGFDVVIDNVGGEQLEAAVRACREGARVVVVGALAGQLAESGAGRTAPVLLDSFQLLLKKIVLRGYSADDAPELRTAWLDRLGDPFRTGKLRFPHVTIEGLERAPEALRATAEGRYFGTVLVAV